MEKEAYTLDRIKEVREEVRVLRIQLQHHARRIETLEVQTELVGESVDIVGSEVSGASDLEDCLERLERRLEEQERRIRALEEAA